MLWFYPLIACIFGFFDGLFLIKSALKGSGGIAYSLLLVLLLGVFYWGYCIPEEVTVFSVTGWIIFAVIGIFVMFFKSVPEDSERHKQFKQMGP